MKILGLFLLLTTSAFAQMLFPQVYNMGTTVQVQIQNNTIYNFNCSGPVNMYPQGGGQETQYYFDYLSAHQFSFRTLYPRSNERVSNISHFISCNRMN